MIPKVNLKRSNSFFKGNDKLHSGEIPVIDSSVLISKGELLKGQLCKKIVGNSTGGLVHIIWDDCGPERCKNFLSNV